MKRILNVVLSALLLAGGAATVVSVAGCKSGATANEMADASYKCAMASCTKTKPANADGTAPS